MAARSGAAPSHEAVSDCRRLGDRVGTGDPFRRNLPHREARLDTKLDTLQRRSLFPVSGGILLADRSEGLAQMELPPDRNRDELDCRLSDRGAMAGLYRQRAQYSFGPAAVPDLRRRNRASAPRHCRAADLLADPVLDVSAQ